MSNVHTLQRQLASCVAARASSYEVLARLLQQVHGSALSPQEESSDLLAVGDAANAKLRMLEDRSGVVVQVRLPQDRPSINPLYSGTAARQQRSGASARCSWRPRGALAAQQNIQRQSCPRSR